ncbi:hypothetical protein HNQ49_002818 [Parapusillimonas granuli]|uniref:Uncharacterized protein n=1 Tax=Parapusillimonas granuli TaxID=380911 RepID=A0A853FYU3_9BURK|nr:hypothetical protein [Parapusillimonas granuli]MBB5216120.1 hypothetical protein [Parapusillimonas granuli]MEB2400396.1 hypothetical protein [Alcaligenaceae bacterium]NYT47801.1 hypothetical protein [Parapusillimonas granuli]
MPQRAWTTDIKATIASFTANHGSVTSRRATSAVPDKIAMIAAGEANTTKIVRDIAWTRKYSGSESFALCVAMIMGR